MEIPLQETLLLGYDNFSKMTHDQKVIAFAAISKLNDIIAEINDEDKTLHIHNVPPTLVPEINNYNRHHTNAQINITDICVDALTNALEQKCVVWDEPAEEMEDDTE